MAPESRTVRLMIAPRDDDPRLESDPEARPRETAPAAPSALATMTATSRDALPDADLEAPSASDGTDRATGREIAAATTTEA